MQKLLWWENSLIWCVQTLKRDFSMSENIQRDTLIGWIEISRLLEIEVDDVRLTLVNKEEEVKNLQDTLEEIKTNGIETKKATNKNKFFGLQQIKQKSLRDPLLLNSSANSASEAT